MPLQMGKNGQNKMPLPAPKVGSSTELMLNPGTRYVVIRYPKLTRTNMHHFSGNLERFSDHELVGGEDYNSKYSELSKYSDLRND